MVDDKGVDAQSLKPETHVELDYIFSFLRGKTGPELGKTGPDLAKTMAMRLRGRLAHSYSLSPMRTGSMWSGALQKDPVIAIKMPGGSAQVFRGTS